MSASVKNIEIERIDALLRLDIPGRPQDDFIRTFIRQIEILSPDLLRTFRKNISEILSDRESNQKGHLKVEAILELLDVSKLQAWLIESGVHERAAKNIIEGLKSRSSEELNRLIHGSFYSDNDGRSLTDMLLESGITEGDTSKFISIIAEMELSVDEILEKVFQLNYLAENAARQEALRGEMNLKELVTLYLYTVLQVVISNYGLDEDMISEIANRIGLCNNMKRQFIIVRQLERYFFKSASVEESKNKPKEFWLKLINDTELKIALEQYVTDEKLSKSDMELAELYSEAHHIFDDVSELQDETLALISITYRLDNPEESGHTVEELLAIIDQIKLLTQEFAPLTILQRDIFSFFEILGECDHRNQVFRKTILTFRRQLRKVVEANEKSGERVTLEQLILTYLYSRLDAYLEDYEGDRPSLLNGIRNRLSQCHAFNRQFAIVDLVEQHVYENPGLIQIADESYWPELINTLELNIILEIYIKREYLVSGVMSLTKNQILDRIQSRIYSIEDISIKSLTVVFLTAQLSALQDQYKGKTITLDDLIHTIDVLQKDATMAAAQISVQSRVKRELLGILTERLFRLEVIQQSLTSETHHELSSRLDEVVVGLRTRRDNLMEGKMDPEELQSDTNQYLTDLKVVKLINDAELVHKNFIASSAREQLKK
ncbi:hypothetical protein JNL27_05235 [bacterium]|nr:hypothetical protein [bacterium]